MLEKGDYSLSPSFSVIVSIYYLIFAGGRLRSAVWVFSGWDYPGLRKLHRLGLLLQSPKRSFASRPPRPQPALPVCVPASRPACNCSHLWLGWWDQDLALRTVNWWAKVHREVIILGWLANISWTMLDWNSCTSIFKILSHELLA